ncbi:MAG: FCD domain-containing protein [Desulfohalobiaceae bacterium]|nr:FCD domain-containing protein [Desulfohalobiaceae bacterium]
MGPSRRAPGWPGDHVHLEDLSPVGADALPDQVVVPGHFDDPPPATLGDQELPFGSRWALLMKGWGSRNLQIHSLPAALSGNRLYEAILTPLLDLTREMVLVVKPEQRVIHDHRDHRLIIDAVISGDAQESAEAMQKHIARVGASMSDLEKVYRKKKGLLL